MSVSGMSRGNMTTALGGLQRASNLQEQRELAGEQMERQQDQTTKMSIGSGIGTGAMIGGYVGGPIGAAVGAVIGGLAGYGLSQA